MPVGTSRLSGAWPSRLRHFAVLGNHDGGIWSSSAGGYRTTAEVSRIVRSARMQLLTNRSHKITQKEVTVQVVGLDDLLARQFDARAAFDRADSQCLTCFHITPTARFS